VDEVAYRSTLSQNSQFDRRSKVFVDYLREEKLVGRLRKIEEEAEVEVAAM